MTHRETPVTRARGLGVNAGAFVAAFTASPTPMVLTDPRQADNPIVWANDAFLALTGYEWDEIDGRNCRMLQGPETDPRAIRRLREAVTAGRPLEVELVNYRKDGSSFWNGMTVAPVHDETGRIVHFYSAQADMTGKHRHEVAMRDAHDELERRVGEQTADLRAALEQKTALLHEVDHRVKNNLQVISSLMLLKARRTPQGEARDALQGMAERIGALSTVHRMLYSTGDVTKFDLREFAEDFVSELVAGLDTDRTAVSAEIDSIAVSAAMAAPLALMMHELATNAVRHAFPGSRPGRITITAQRSAGGLRMLIEDDGIGMASGTPNPAGFGRSLVEMVVRQLRGVIAWSDVSPGTRVEITVPLDAISLQSVMSDRAAEPDWASR
ncbi:MULTISPECIES: PAS domain-containing protein [unclassified Methylobacterium]|uniref:PAS domain-containing protein n=1 Tax=unclassified Methylobacterium TaxID=2615210 RepID=UPI0006F96DD8|nr:MULTISPECIES: PAS domain-containing protein [unclassified Methylobacterium]KQP96700.1 PAS sensor protein [Methylobacterium sp. Leaf117]MCK2052832.1 PAS domain-containing protein [Methylobacterium sp. 37f]